MLTAAPSVGVPVVGFVIVTDPPEIDVVAGKLLTDTDPLMAGIDEIAAVMVSVFAARFQLRADVKDCPPAIDTALVSDTGSDERVSPEIATFSFPSAVRFSGAGVVPSIATATQAVNGLQKRS
jgi:hypothetical protein